MDKSFCEKTIEIKTETQDANSVVARDGCCNFELSGSISFLEENKNKEITDDIFSLDEIELLQIVNKTKKLTLFPFSKLRKVFTLSIAWQNNKRVMFAVDNMDILVRNDCTTNELFITYLKKALIIVWNATLCKHCTTVCFIQDICRVCKPLSLITYVNNNECIICKDTLHPIYFRCATCIDSQICTLCQSKRPYKTVCSICKKNPQDFFNSSPVIQNTSRYISNNFFNQDDDNEDLFEEINELIYS